MKFSIKGFFSKCDQIHSFLRIWYIPKVTSQLAGDFICQSVLMRLSCRNES